ncbi:MAG TPA: RNA polymerase sigma-70 factor [Chitinophaga sp.]|uniref:RNA polymerase sigma factor n=1 Tax=Chitinophaga sp. TaxID=1869181 RepID=UPI002CC4A831|nr:RNA polymerase sigma-70 factor [Chitinophaga sp.]HVI49186.1 RNA polymerase sigma-70 factor [Chitinophaga sp.]
MDQALKLYEDRILFSRIARGDEAAFRMLYHRYNAVLSGAVRKLLKSDDEAAEVLQEVFLKVWLQRDTLEGIENPGGWLYTMASNYSLSVLRKHARRIDQEGHIPDDEIPDDNNLPEAFYAKELQGLISKAVDKLPDSRREIFMMSTQEGRSRKEIAGALKISEHTVKNQLVTARRFIRDYLEQHTGQRLPVVIILLLAGLL